MQTTRVIRRLHPCLPEWLISRHEQGLHISPDDVIRIVAFDRSAASDPIVCDYVLRALRGELKKRPGRRRTAVHELRLRYATAEVEYLAERLTRRRERQRRKGIRKSRAGYSPTDLALQVVASRLGFSSLEVLRNALSSWKKGLNSRV